jgi:GR25 family glycosyltransferase involved in LPS biosynthesis
MQISNVDQEVKLVKFNKESALNSCYVINPRTEQRYLDLSNEFHLAVDDFMDLEFFTKIPIFSFFPNVVSRSASISTIRIRKVKSKTKLKDKLYIEFHRVRQQLPSNFSFHEFLH